MQLRDPDPGPLLTDLYELTMLQAYRASGMNDTAVFEMFVRALPPKRNFLLVAGLEQVAGYLLALRLSDNDLAWLASTGRFDSGFLDSLRDFRYTGDLDAMPEGTVVFAGEPLLRRKRSEGKGTWPGRRQVFRSVDGEGRICGDLLGLDSDDAPGERLLVPVLRAGRRVGPPPSLESLRERAREQMAMLPEALRALAPAAPYPVALSPSLRALADAVDAQAQAGR